MRMNIEIRQSTIYYAGLLGRWDKRIVDQASDVPSIIFFHNFLQNSLQKSFQFIFLFFHNFTKIKIKSFEYSSQQPTALFSIYQNNTWTIRGLVDETIDPATQRIILKIVGFHIWKYILASVFQLI